MDSEICLRVWIEKNNLPFLGPGRILLLEKVAEHGSITKAAADLKMSYRKAWQLIADMNTLSDVDLVVKSVGGAKGGGALITDKGKNTIENYRLLQKLVDEVLEKSTENFRF